MQLIQNGAVGGVKEKYYQDHEIWYVPISWREVLLENFLIIRQKKPVLTVGTFLRGTFKFFLNE